MPLVIIVTDTLVLEPSAGSTCYIGLVRLWCPLFAAHCLEGFADSHCFASQQCNITTQPSQLTTAPTFLILLLQDGHQPVSSTGEALNPVIGSLFRSSAGMVDNGRTLTYTSWYPTSSLPMGWYTVTVKSPSTGFDAITGESAPFYLQFPYVWVAGQWTSCTYPLGCGLGYKTRDVYCHDNRTSAYRAPGTVPNVTIRMADYSSLGVFLAPDQLCSSNTPHPVTRQK
jgi:hypothetical protein